MPFEPVKAPVTALHGPSVNPPFLPHKLRSRAELEWSKSHSSVEHAPLKCGTRSTQVFQRYQTSFAGEPNKLSYLSIALLSRSRWMDFSK